jgi:hypothetical protein
VSPQSSPPRRFIAAAWRGLERNAIEHILAGLPKDWTKLRYLRGHELDDGASAPAPGARCRPENVGSSANDFGLLFRRKPNHSPPRVGISKSREDLVPDAKIGMRHVRALLRLRQRKGKATKLISGHDVACELLFPPFDSYLKMAIA